MVKICRNKIRRSIHFTGPKWEIVFINAKSLAGEELIITLMGREKM